MTSRDIDYRDGISIGIIVAYTPVLAIAVILCLRQGFGRSAGWFFILIFSLIRLVGAAFELRIIVDPSSTSLYIAEAILQNIGLSPLELASMGLLSRVVTAINVNSRTVIQSTHIKLAELVVQVALILGIVGGVNASGNFAKTGTYVVQTLSKVSLGLLIVAFIAILIFTGATSFRVSHAGSGEKRLLLAVALSLPFMLIRLVYSSLYTIGGRKQFSTLPPNGSVTPFLVLAVLQEFIVVVLYEVFGLALTRIKRDRHGGERFELQDSDASRSHLSQTELHANMPGREEKMFVEKIGSFLGKRTIIGRLVVRASGRNA